jgi:hypothetical protein
MPISRPPVSTVIRGVDVDPSLQCGSAAINGCRDRVVVIVPGGDEDRAGARDRVGAIGPFRPVSRLEWSASSGRHPDLAVLGFDVRREQQFRPMHSVDHAL